MMIDSSLWSAARIALNARAARAFSSSGTAVHDAAVPDQVVGEDDGSRPRQLQAEVEISRVARLVGVDEDQVERRHSLVDQPLQGLFGRSDVNGDASAHSRAIDILSRHVGVLLIQLEAGDRPALG